MCWPKDGLGVANHLSYQFQFPASRINPRKASQETASSREVSWPLAAQRAWAVSEEKEKESEETKKQRLAACRQTVEMEELRRREMEVAC
jgi:hypothetical protein